MASRNIDEVVREVKSIILDSLDIEDEANIDLSTNLMADLDAESLDFLDIVFRIEERFGMRIERGRIERQLRERFGDIEIKPNTDLTTEMKAALQEIMPEVPLERMQGLRKVKEISKLFTVATFVRMANEAIISSGSEVSYDAADSSGFSGRQLGVA